MCLGSPQPEREEELSDIDIFTTSEEEDEGGASDGPGEAEWAERIEWYLGPKGTNWCF